MMGITHIALSLTGVACATGSVDPSVMLLAAIGSQIPDMDTTKSWIGKASYPLASYLEQKFSHRSITHSFFVSLALLTVTAPVLYYFNWTLWVAAPLGHLISCFADCSTKLGCQFFYPVNKDYWVVGLNPNNRIETGKAGDYAVLTTAVCMFSIAFYLITGGGGIGAWATRTLFPTSQTAVELLRQENQKAIAIHVEGVRKIDNSRVDEQYWAISASGSNLVVKDKNDNIFRVGEAGEVIPKRVNTLADRLPLKIRRQRIEDASAAEWVNSLPEKALVTGTLVIEDASEVQLPITPPGVMPTVTSTGNGVALEHASRKDLKPLQDFYILSGETLIKQL